jgi:hypothetical protein
MEPMYQVVLYYGVVSEAPREVADDLTIVVKMARCCGWQSSVIKRGAEPCAMATPKPRKNRAAMNMEKFTEALWRTTANIMIVLTGLEYDDHLGGINHLPIQIPHRRPKPSAMYGVTGSARRDPKNMMPENRPLMEAERPFM